MYTLQRVSRTVLAVVLAVVLASAFGTTEGSVRGDLSTLVDLRSAPARTELPSRNLGLAEECVACDACNASGGNHKTFGGGARDGGVHSGCFEGLACDTPHPFNTNCGGGDYDGAFDTHSEQESITWSKLAEAEDEALRTALLRAPDRWRYSSARSALQLYDCNGVLVANLPVRDRQVAAVSAALSLLGAGQ